MLNTYSVLLPFWIGACRQIFFFKISCIGKTNVVIPKLPKGPVCWECLQMQTLATLRNENEVVWAGHHKGTQGKLFALMTVTVLKSFIIESMWMTQNKRSLCHRHMLSKPDPQKVTSIILAQRLAHLFQQPQWFYIHD